jgi:hypothetical protein
MSDASELAAAQALLLSYVPVDKTPKLGEDEWKARLVANKSAGVWLVNSFYNVGDETMPPIRNGHRYRCAVPGTSQAVDPGYYFWPQSSGASVQEVSTPPSTPALVWTENGPQYPSAYDVRQAAYECWDLKVQKAAAFVQDGDIHFEQVYAHCKEQRDFFTPLR